MKGNVLWLNPIFSMFEKQRLIGFALFVAAALLLSLVGGHDLVPTVIFIVLFSITYIFSGTNRIIIERDMVKFTYYHSVRRAGKSRRTRVKYIVTDIEDLRFEQNKLEKIFGCGHFSFRGNSLYEARWEGFEPKTSFTFYGLPRFRQTKKEICDILGVNETE